jgi:hypothetical protein
LRAVGRSGAGAGYHSATPRSVRCSSEGAAEAVGGIVRAARKVSVECRLLGRRLLCLECCGPGRIPAAIYRTTRNPRCVAAGVTSTWVRSRVIEPPGPAQTRQPSGHATAGQRNVAVLGRKDDHGLSQHDSSSRHFKMSTQIAALRLRITLPTSHTSADPVPDVEDQSRGPQRSIPNRPLRR